MKVGRGQWEADGQAGATHELSVSKLELKKSRKVQVEGRCVIFKSGKDRLQTGQEIMGLKFS